MDQIEKYIEELMEKSKKPLFHIKDLQEKAKEQKQEQTKEKVRTKKQTQKL